MGQPEKVLIMRCDAYDPDRIRGIVREGMETLGARPTGKVLLKPNVVMAHPEIFPHAFTRKEFLDGVLGAVRDRAEGAREIAVGERSGITIPTRYNFRNAGYPEVLRRHRVKAYYFDESRQVPVAIHGRDNLRRTLFIPKPVVESDYLVNLPKFKAHPWCRLTLSLKNFIGIQDDRHRLVDHNIFLEHKIADLQEVIQPRFIAVDGIIAGQKMMLTPTPFPMGAILMGTNSCAVDTVGAHMVNLDPKSVIHLRMAAERGFGPISLSEIEVGGDFPLEEMQEKTKEFQFCMERVDDYFGKESRLSCTVGTFPEAHSPDYCWGGCPGALQEAMHIFRGFDPEVDRKMKKVRYVVGKVEGSIPLEEGERVLFAGNCTSWAGTLNGQEVRIESSYRSPGEVDERKAASNDMFLKMFQVFRECFRNRASPYMHARGCTVSVGDHVHFLSRLGGIPNPLFDPRLSVPVNIAYWRMRAGRLLNRLFG